MASRMTTDKRLEIARELDKNKTISEISRKTKVSITTVARLRDSRAGIDWVIAGPEAVRLRDIEGLSNSQIAKVLSGRYGFNLTRGAVSGYFDRHAAPLPEAVAKDRKVQGAARQHKNNENMRWTTPPVDTGKPSVLLSPAMRHLAQFDPIIANVLARQEGNPND